MASVRSVAVCAVPPMVPCLTGHIGITLAKRAASTRLAVRGARVAFPFGDAAAICSPLRGRVLGSLEHPRVDNDTRDDIDYFAALRPRPVSLKEILGPLEPGPLAKFIVREVPVRYAERIRWIEEIPDWEHIPQLQDTFLVKHGGIFGPMSIELWPR